MSIQVTSLDTEPRQSEKYEQQENSDPDTPSKRLIGKNVSAGNLLKKSCPGL